MKKIIEGCLYNTETAEEICNESFGYSNDFNYWSITLYRTKKGQYFKYGEGGARSEFAEKISTNTTAGGERLWLVSIDEAREFVAKVDVEKALEMFGDEIEEG